MADVAALARRAGQLAHDILSGVAPESLPFEIRTDGVPMFDWPALKRWGISEARLAARQYDSEIVPDPCGRNTDGILSALSSS